MILPCVCPSCNAQLKVKSLVCEECETEVLGRYSLPTLFLLSKEEQSFVINFIKFSGSLKEMAKLLELSYPTVRNKLNDIIEKLESYEK